MFVDKNIPQMNKGHVRVSENQVKASHLLSMKHKSTSLIKSKDEDALDTLIIEKGCEESKKRRLEGLKREIKSVGKNHELM